jgi:lysophospholipase L1-like esterase
MISEAYHSAYEVHINRLTATGTAIFVGEIMPTEKRKVLHDAYFDNNAIRELNTDIMALADRYRVTRIDLHDAFAQPGDNSMRPGLTVDGVHLNADGYRLWRHMIAQAVSGRLKCDPTVSAR